MTYCLNCIFKPPWLKSSAFDRQPWQCFAYLYEVGKVSKCQRRSASNTPTPPSYNAAEGVEGSIGRRPTSLRIGSSENSICTQNSTSKWFQIKSPINSFIYYTHLLAQQPPKKKTTTCKVTSMALSGLYSGNKCWRQITDWTLPVLASHWETNLKHQGIFFIFLNHSRDKNKNSSCWTILSLIVY